MKTATTVPPRFRLAGAMLLGATLALGVWACGNKLPDELAQAEPSQPEAKPPAAPEAMGEVTRPPFSMTGDLEGLLLVWFDEKGLHTASRRSDIPEARRQHVRVDSLHVAPERRLDQDFVYLADLRQPGDTGDYAVRKCRRDVFEALVDGAAPDAVAGDTPAGGAPKPDSDSSPAGGPQSNADVVIYGASWCGACRAAASYLKSRNIPFVQKDIEKDSAAYAEMQRKTTAAGVKPGGLPVIDFRGKILSGFDPGAINRLINSQP